MIKKKLNVWSRVEKVPGPFESRAPTVRPMSSPVAVILPGCIGGGFFPFSLDYLRSSCFDCFSRLAV